MHSPQLGRRGLQSYTLVSHGKLCCQYATLLPMVIFRNLHLLGDVFFEVYAAEKYCSGC